MNAAERTTGLILRVHPFSETSSIVHWMTADAGRLATLAKGARRPSSPYRGKLDLYFLSDLTFRRSRRSGLHLLQEVGLKETFPALRRSLQALRQTAYCARLIEQTTETDTPLPEALPLLLDLLRALSGNPPLPQFVLAFELRWLVALGQQPDFASPRFAPALRNLLTPLATAPWPDLPPLASPPQDLTRVAQFLHGFLIYHLDRIPSGRSAALMLPAPAPAGTQAKG